MAYIGNKADTAFTSLLKQDLTGASGTSLTLTHAVANANDIALYINNVRQEPTEAYSVNGTTVTLTGSVAGTDDIYVIYLARAVQTTVPPDGSVSSAKIANSAVDLTSKVTGVLPKANGGTGGTVTGVTTLTEQATTSGTTKDFTVPSTAKVIYVSLMGVSFSGSNDTFMIQIGDSGGIETSGYTSAVAYTGGGTNNNGDNYNSGTTDNGFFIYFSAGAGATLYGHATIINGGGNKFTCSAQITASAYISNGAGYKELSSGITTVRLTTVNGRTFDAGAVNVTYVE